MKPSIDPASPGHTFPLGASISGDGVNFSVYSKSATAVELLLFDRPDDASPRSVIPMAPPRGERVFHYWNVHVAGLGPGQIYAFRARGPFDPGQQLWFDHEKVLLDPYGRALVVPGDYDRKAGSRPGPNTAAAMKSVVARQNNYDWEGDEPLGHSFTETVIYEMHVGGFTKHPNSGLPPELRGTYRGLIEKIPYLKSLGITAVELQPVFQFDPQVAPPGLTEYWGYNPVSFFVPHSGYATTRDPLAVMDEFRDMVKALHRAGIEVILDVVYNHTAEGDENGPVFCFKGLDAPAYYLPGARPGECFANYSGTGNTLNAEHAVVRRMILDSLRYWVTEFHVDGFRFDLASILARDGNGTPLPNPPVLWDIETDPVLTGTKLIAEAWDAAGLYQVGNFFGDHWREWNGHFRDDIRAFVKGDPGHAATVPQRFFASPDIYGHKSRGFDYTINFITSHDGFTLNDVVSYNEKHNGANGEDGRDGHNENLSWNCGAEGPSDDPAVEALRLRQIKNLQAVNLLSLGVPMLLMGDEVRRTQYGNNNAYCQDNEVSWFDWSLPDRHGEVLHFTRELLHLRRLHHLVGEPGMPLEEMLERAKIRLHGTEADCPDLGHDSRSVAFSASGPRYDYLVVLNAYWKPLSFEFPDTARRDGRWRRLIDTALPPPEDIARPDQARVIDAPAYRAAARSVAVFVHY